MNNTVLIPASRVSVTATAKYLKLFEGFPILHAKFIPLGSKLVLPLKTDFSPFSLEMIAESNSSVLLSYFDATMKFETPELEQTFTEIKQKQYRMFTIDKYAQELAREILQLATIQKERMVSELQELYTLDRTQFDQAVKQLSVPASPRWRNFAFAAEANIANEYWKIMGNVFRELGWEFEKRSKRPAENATNALLNYSYAILKSVLNSIILVHGLDPFVGFLHTLRPGRESLTLDLMEPFRQYVDAALLEALLSEAMKQHYFKTEGSGIVLQDKAKELVQAFFYKKFMLGTQAPITSIIELIGLLVQRLETQ